MMGSRVPDRQIDRDLWNGKENCSVHRELQEYLHTHIPISRAMGVEVIEANPDGVRLSAPLAPNINHRETVFGGSASAVAILSAWTLLHVRLQQEGANSRVVIQRNSMNFLRPMAGPFTATARIAVTADWSVFIGTLRRKYRARISVVVDLHVDAVKSGEFEGDFVALGVQPT